MLHTLMHRRFICTIFFPFNSSSNQNDIEKWSKESKVFMDNFKSYIWNKEGYITKEAQSVINTTSGGIMSGFILGALTKAKDVPEIYETENKATIYNTRYQAYKELQYKMTKNLMKGGFLFALKLGTFSFIFSSISTVLYIYKGKFNILNCTYSGAITGFIFKMNMGLKGAFAGTLLGSIVGTIYGGFSSLLLYITGTRMNGLYETRNLLLTTRQEKIKEKSIKLTEKEILTLEKLREKDASTNIMENQE